MARRQSADPLERYDTPAWMTRALLQHCPRLAGRSIFEPCAGAGAIASVLEGEGACVVTALDIEPRHPLIGKADTLSSTAHWPRDPIGIVTNTPFSRAADLVRLAEAQGVGFLFLLARLTFLERTGDRDDLRDPDLALVLPRMKPWFTGKGTDSCTVAWFGWFSEPNIWPTGVRRLGKTECRGYLESQVPA